jgi:hypothetical protein
MSSVIKVAQEKSTPIDRPEFRAAGRTGESGASAIVPAVTERDLCGNWQAPAKAADRHHRTEAAGVNGTLNLTVMETPDERIAWQNS